MGCDHVERKAVMHSLLPCRQPKNSGSEEKITFCKHLTDFQTILYRIPTHRQVVRPVQAQAADHHCEQAPAGDMSWKELKLLGGSIKHQHTQKTLLRNTMISDHMGILYATSVLFGDLT